MLGPSAADEEGPMRRALRGILGMTLPAAFAALSLALAWAAQ